MAFPSNTFAVQGQDAYMYIVLRAKDHGKNFSTLLKTTKVYPSDTFPVYGK